MSRAASQTAWTLSRAAGIDMNPMHVTSRANQFATKATGFDSTVLLLRREDDTMRGYLVTSGLGGDPARAATDLAHTVGAHASEVDVPEGLDIDNVVGWLVFESGSAVARDAQLNADPTEIARQMANTLPPGCWVAVSLRKPTKKERTRNHAWLSHRLSTAVPTHHSMAPDAVAVSIYAGGPDAATVSDLLDSARSAMPGFDVTTKSQVATRASAFAGPGLTGIATIATGIGSAFVDSVPDIAGPALLVPGLGLGFVALLIGLGRFAGALPSAWKHTQSMARMCRFDPPRKRIGRPRPPQKEINRSDKYREARDGDYPLHPAVFQVGPQVVVGLVAPQAGAVSGEAETLSRDVPPTMLRRLGPLVGDSDRGPAYLSALDASGGCAIIGKPGSGKSVFVRSMYGWSCLERVSPSGLPGFPGARNSLVAFESKGNGVAQYQAWADATGDVMVVIDIADPGAPGRDSYAIDLFAVPGTVFDKANFFVNALVYAFGDGAIGDRSFETLLSLVAAALLVTPETAGLVADVNPHGSPVYFTHVLLGGRGDETGRALAAELSAESLRPGADPMLREAVVGMGPLYGANVTPAQRRALVEAPRNKMRQLLELESWWSPSRPKVTWAQIIEGHNAVVINTGTSRHGQMVEEELNKQMSALLMFSLRHAIQRICADWEDEGRAVSIFADELSLLAGSSESVIAWLKDQGRSFGVRPFLATQRPDQLSERVRKPFMNFSTLVSFTQEDITTAREISDAVSGAEGEWSAADLLQLAPYTAVIRAHVEKKRQPAFTIKTRHFEGDRSTFADQQGYPDLDTVAMSDPTPTVEPTPVTMAPAPVEDIPAQPTYPVAAPAPIPSAEPDADPNDTNLMAW